MYITTESIKSEMAVVSRFTSSGSTILTTLSAQREDSSKITIQATGATSWRRADVKYRKNEAFVDVIETVNLLMSKEGMLSVIFLLANVAEVSLGRFGITRGRGWTNHDEGVSERHTGM
jgi:hypothetical protein